MFSPFQDRQGIVKQIYRGTIFLYDENEQENGGYFCSKAQMCEKVKLSGDASKDKVHLSANSNLETRLFLQTITQLHKFSEELLM